MSFENVVQKQIYDALSTALSASVYGIEAPQKATFPYVTIGDSSAVENDTDTEIGQFTTYTINVWSRERGEKQVREIQGEIYNALHLVKFAESGYSFTENYFLTSDVFIDQDGKTRHGVQTFKLTIEEI